MKKENLIRQGRGTLWTKEIASFLLFCSLIIGCAAEPPLRKKEAPVPVKKKPAITIKEDPRKEREKGIRAALIKDGTLQSSPHLLAEELKIIPRFSQVLVSGYEESGNHQGYLRVEYDNISGYLSTMYVHIDHRLEQFIESEKKKIYKRNVQTLEIIENSQREIESRKVWVKSMIVEVRTSPSVYSTIKDSLERGWFMFVQEEKDDWYRVLYAGPVFDFESVDYTYIANIFNKYKDPASLVAAYMDGWVQKSSVSDWEVEKITDDETRRRIFVEENPGLHLIIKEAILNGDIIIGMSKDMVIASWGMAEEITRSGSAFSTYEEWIYGDTYLYFENDILSEWQNFNE
ncbi:MAG: hypothetical protein JSU99_04780 [Nitrospiraceae bacterium]|nr:MAG: hypothetical protein JSU99_04780 [Nitrospiraceae bacterium]